MRIVLCVTGSVAAVETVKLSRELKRKGFQVKCFMSDGACDIINPNALEFATGEEVITKITGKIEHVKYANKDLILVAPATANVISKFAHKIADNPINTLLVTANGFGTPIIFVPSMHQSMYQAVDENIRKLKNEGIIFIEPREEENKAKFPSIDSIILQVQKATSNEQLKGKNVLVSAGGTYEDIDPVRGITNRSSGKMGLELAKEAFRRGANVTMVTGRMGVHVPTVFNHIKAESTIQMQDEIMGILSDQNIFIAAAAVSDFRVEKQESKITSKDSINLKLKPTPKIINKAKKYNKELYLVGFKAEYNVSNEYLLDSARKIMDESGADLMVANDVSIEGAGFGSNQNKVVLIDDEVLEVPLSTKKEISAVIIDRIIKKIS